VQKEVGTGRTLERLKYTGRRGIKRGGERAKYRVGPSQTEAGFKGRKKKKGQKKEFR